MEEPRRYGKKNRTIPLEHTLTVATRRSRGLKGKEKNRLNLTAHGSAESGPMVLPSSSAKR